MSRRHTAATLLAAVVALSGCGLELQDLPAPDALGDAPRYTITAHFTDVQNLAIGAKVKLSGVVIGDVVSIATKDYVAGVTMEIEKKFVLSDAAEFQIRFTTPLGEDFVAVTSGPVTGAARLADRAEIPVQRTSDAPSIEDTFAAVSTLLNGGGLDQIHTIATELQQLLHGRTGQVRDLLTQLDALVGNLDDHKGDIDRVLTGLRSLGEQLNSDDATIERALVEFPPALQVLADNTDGLARLLRKVGGLGSTVRDLVTRSSGSMTQLLDNLRPTLETLRAADAQLVPTFKDLIRFGRLFDRATPGDYVNLDATIVGLLDAPGYQPRPGGETNSARAVRLGPTSSAAVAALLGDGTP